MMMIKPGLAMLQDIICKELVSRISKQGSAIDKAMTVAAEADCLISLSLAAINHNLVQPELCEENVLYISRGQVCLVFSSHRLF